MGRKTGSMTKGTTSFGKRHNSPTLCAVVVDVVRSTFKRRRALRADTLRRKLADTTGGKRPSVVRQLVLAAAVTSRLWRVVPRTASVRVPPHRRRVLAVPKLVYSEMFAYRSLAN